MKFYVYFSYNACLWCHLKRHPAALPQTQKAPVLSAMCMLKTNQVDVTLGLRTELLQELHSGYSDGINSPTYCAKSWVKIRWSLCHNSSGLFLFQIVKDYHQSKPFSVRCVTFITQQVSSFMRSSLILRNSRKAQIANSNSPTYHILGAFGP
jgi:hypothetical protein